ncbi:Tim44 domain-containing protein [Methylovirgula sp. 4M-Z18]|uniref:Tim44 domain-containing protein n=1 Tax=Methylovirgula sp. 4M-Z18 TaxID=2293567 RepID=UPI000E2FDE13|nr:TIM44-like domain-containing protein [Methylovirgula sp. 4M-Z18]RFB78152.1 hypothetical protein DYH55_17370 [Methylovirgula sp. 4M-Z18]
MVSSLLSRRKLAAIALAGALALAPQLADAKMGGGGSFGSRGSFTYRPPPVTNTAPRTASPFDRSITPSPNQSLLRPNVSTTGNRGLFGGAFGRGLLGGLIGAGLFGLLTGNGFFGGIGSLMSLIGLMLQIGLIFLVGRWLLRRMGVLAPASAAYGGGSGFQPPPSMAPSFGQSPPTITPLAIQPADYQTFERLLHDVQAAYTDEDKTRLFRLTTPEVAGYLGAEIDANASHGQTNRLTGVQLLQGDLAEAWREGPVDYASVAMRFANIDVMVDRATGRVLSGDPRMPAESTEVWTFRRPANAGPSAWTLSAVQQA